MKVIETIKKRAKSYQHAYHEFRQESSFVRRRRPVIFDETENKFEKFLDLFTFYLCLECGKSAGDWHPTHADWNRGHHNGALLQQMSRAKKVDVFKGIMNAYRVFLNHADNPINLEEELGKAFIDTGGSAPQKDVLHRTLEYFYINQGETFIRHGIELLHRRDYRTESDFPPKSSMASMSLSEDGVTFAIDSDIIPFNTCFNHGNRWPWYYCGGCITVSDFRRLGGKIVRPGDRDHFYARSNLKVDDWCFVYQRKIERTKAMASSIDGLRESIIEIKQSGARHIEKSVLSKFFILVSMLRQKLALQEIEVV
ncbi:MAG: hypothetical protein HRU33_03615 [Rhodobacteraceae bacterium]|nr:hypothetical protein [Paracoccaceae bacterium]